MRDRHVDVLPLLHIISNRKSLHSELTAEQSVHKSRKNIVGRSYFIEPRHDVARSAFLETYFERTGVYLAYRLFVRPRRNGTSALFLVVEERVLEIYIYSFGLYGFGKRRTHLARKHGVFAEILEIPAAVRRTVHVQSRSVQSRIARPKRVFAPRFAVLRHKFDVESGGGYTVARICRRIFVLVRIVFRDGKTAIYFFVIIESLVYAHRAVMIYRLRLGYRVYRARHALAAREEFNGIFPRQLVEQIVPHGVVVRYRLVVGRIVVAVAPRAKIHKRIRRLSRSVRRISYIVFGSFLELLLPEVAFESRVESEPYLIVEHDVVIAYAELYRTVPILSRNIRHGVVASVFVSVNIGIIEAVDNFRLRIRDGILFRVHSVRIEVETDAVLGQSYLMRERGNARTVHSSRRVFGSVTLGGEYVVCRVVSVARYREIVVALFRDICSLAVRVVRREILAGNFYRHGFARIHAAFEHTRLCKTDKLDCSFFHAVRHVVIGIRLLRVYLHRLLARGVARVGDGHADGVYVRFRVIRERRFGVIERRIRHSVSERICHDFRIVVVARVAAVRHIVFVTRFGIAVSDVNALLIHYVTDAVRRAKSVYFKSGRASTVRHSAAERIVAEIGIDGIITVICPERVRQPPRRIDVADEYVAYRARTRRTERAAPKNGIYAQLLTVGEIQFHLIGGVQYHYYLVERRAFERF